MTFQGKQKSKAKDIMRSFNRDIFQFKGLEKKVKGNGTAIDILWEFFNKKSFFYG
mgnify:CR=1 FL=1